jgi:hypothetical protein
MIGSIVDAQSHMYHRFWFWFWVCLQVQAKIRFPSLLKHAPRTIPFVSNVWRLANVNNHNVGEVGKFARTPCSQCSNILPQPEWTEYHRGSSHICQELLEVHSQPRKTENRQGLYMDLLSIFLDRYCLSVRMRNCIERTKSRVRISSLDMLVNMQRWQAVTVFFFESE